MVFDILILTVVVVMAAVLVLFMIDQNKEQNRTLKHLSKLAVKVAELEDAIDRVDKSTGTEMNRLGLEFKNFRELYGDAAVEAYKAEAEAQKVFAKGVANLMSYDGTPQDEGD